MEVSIGSQPISEHCVNLSLIIDALTSTPQVQFMLLLIYVYIIFASLALAVMEKTSWRMVRESSVAQLKLVSSTTFHTTTCASTMHHK